MAFCASLESNTSLRGSLFFIASEDLEAGVEEAGSKSGETLLATLLPLINDTVA